MAVVTRIALQHL